MYKIYFSFLIFIISISTYSQNKECSNFKVGNFRYSHPEYSKYKVVRTENLQIETDTITGFKVKGTIKWISDCEYELIYSEISDSRFNAIIGQKVTAFITNIDGNKIICKSECMGIKLDMEMIKTD